MFENPLNEKASESNSEESLDEKWFQKFESLKTASYSLLAGRKSFRDEEKSKLISGEIRNPTLDYPKLVDIDLDRREADLVALKEEIIAEEENEVVRKAYHWKLNEKIAAIRMIKATREGDDEAFFRYSKFIYGTPSPELFLYSMKEFRDLVQSKQDLDIETVREASERLNNELFADKPFLDNPVKIGDAVLTIENDDESEKILNAEEIKRLFDEVLKEHDELNEWEAVIDESGNRQNFSASQANREVRIPGDDALKNRKKDRLTTERQVKGLIEHEILTHALRREKGERSRLKLLGKGLDRYIEGEEGVATFRESEVKRSTGIARLEKHLAIALALGYDGKKRDFGSIFDILRDYYICDEEASNEQEVDRAESLAWKDCVRIFRGTTCSTPGAVFTKDIVYREGNVAVRKLMKRFPELNKQVSIGKYDPNNDRHVWVLEQLEITDDDLNM